MCKRGREDARARRSLSKTLDVDADVDARARRSLSKTLDARARRSLPPFSSSSATPCLPATPAPSVTPCLSTRKSHGLRCSHVAATGAAVKLRPRCGNVDDGIGDGTGAGTVQLHHTTSFLHQAPLFFCGTFLPLIELCEGGRCLRLRLGHHLFFACCSSTMAWRVASSASERSATQPLQKSSEKSARPSAGLQRLGGAAA